MECDLKPLFMSFDLMTNEWRKTEKFSAKLINLLYLYNIYALYGYVVHRAAACSLWTNDAKRFVPIVFHLFTMSRNAHIRYDFGFLL